MDLAISCKDKLAYFRIKELKDVLGQLGLAKQGKKQDLMDRILSVISDEQGNAYFLLSELHHFLLNGYLLVFTIEERRKCSMKIFSKFFQCSKEEEFVMLNLLFHNFFNVLHSSIVIRVLIHTYFSNRFKSYLFTKLTLLYLHSSNQLLNIETQPLFLTYIKFPIVRSWTHKYMGLLMHFILMGGGFVNVVDLGCHFGRMKMGNKDS
ncbi:hypothetical protein IEQ34_005888 [Dendrobium chrysotoxum]|uniref:SAP domain-containing protein n=1 Tax=Dendrobium chrysotoxum TaxID=161865 RepID=A0AAV7HE91_DENCH|nr:hypothetical protein IEQ34_005888 [Dendrobium chrysotoxum]